MEETYFSPRFKNDYAFLNINGSSEDTRDFFVEFINDDTNEVEYSVSTTINHWSKLNNIGDRNILIRVSADDKILFERKRNDVNKIFNRVFIKFGSKSLGDTVAWMPCVEEYRITHNVEVVLSTSHNYLFDKAYPEIIFSDINHPDHIIDVDKKFRLDYGPELSRINGVLAPEEWYINNEYYDNFVNYFDYRKYPLQAIGKMILGLPLDEVVPKINIPEGGPKIKGKYVVVAMQSTSQLKYWNNPFGWERVFDFLGRNGYKIVLIDRYKNFGVVGSYNQAPKSKYVIDKTGNYPLSERIIDIKYADMMIGLSSGLAWISWAIGTPVVMISGFTKPWLEFQSNIARIHNSTVCNGCWNDPNITYEAADWMFCPKKADFICSKAIQPKDVIDGIKKFMK